jgi:transcriptional regulator with XRE-family HTH domain
MKKFNEVAIIERLQSLRKQYAGNRGKSKFARALGISASTYKYYESSRVPPIEILLRICHVTGADLEWLLTDHSTEKKFAFGPNSVLLRKLSTLLNENPDLAEPILAFFELLWEKKGVEKVFQSKSSADQTESARMDSGAWKNCRGNDSFLESDNFTRAQADRHRP